MDELRKAFEAKFPVPDGTRWDGERYEPESYGATTQANADEHQARWEGWVAAAELVAKAERERIAAVNHPPSAESLDAEVRRLEQKARQSGLQTDWNAFNEGMSRLAMRRQKEEAQRGLNMGRELY